MVCELNGANRASRLTQICNDKNKIKKDFPFSTPYGWGRNAFYKGAFGSNYIAPLGPQVNAFEREFAEKVVIPYAVAVSSGTAAMP